MDDRHLADTAAIAAMLEISADRIRHYAHRRPDLLPRQGTRGRRTLYAIEDAEKLAGHLGIQVDAAMPHRS